jgi:signal transduction histidine kinase
MTTRLGAGGWFLVGYPIGQIASAFAVLLVPQLDPPDWASMVLRVLSGGLAAVAAMLSARRQRGAVGDVLALTTGLALAAWVFVLQHVATDPGLSLSARVAAIAYPVVDLLALAVMLRLLLGPPAPGEDRDTTRLLVGLALAALVAPGILFYQAWQGDVRDGVAIALGSTLLFLLVGGRFIWLLRRLGDQSSTLVERNRSLRAEDDIREQYLATESARLAREQDLRAEVARTNVALTRAVRLKGEFLANMSHELRTPLHAILAMCEALREGLYGPLADRPEGGVRTMEASGRHLLALINDILDLSKIEAGKLTLAFAPVQLGSICRDGLQAVSPLAARKQIQLHQELPARSPTISADETRLRQMLVNLLSNAVKFTPPGGQVGLQLASHGNRGDVRLTVWDTGPGIASQDAERVFTPFVQLDAGLNRKHEGTGLGLALVRRLAELHGGRVHLESTPAAGSRFSVVLPANPRAPIRADG